MILQKWKEAVMLHRLVHEFLDYCRLANFSDRSIQALTARLTEFQAYLKNQTTRSVTQIKYLDLIAFVADFGSPFQPCAKITGVDVEAVLSFLDLKSQGG